MKFRIVVFSIIALVALVAGPLTNSAKRSIGEWLYTNGHDTAALQIYRILAWSGDVVGKNNYAALIFRQQKRTERETAQYRAGLSGYVSEAFAQLGDTNALGSFNQLMLSAGLEGQSGHDYAIKSLKKYKQQNGAFAARLIKDGEQDVPTYELVRRIAELDDPIAAFEFTSLVHHANPPDAQDLKLKFYRKAAEAGFVPGMEELGDLLLERPTSDREKDEGMKWLVTAAELGSRVSAKRLVDCHQFGFYGCPKINFTEAAKWVELAVLEQAPYELPRYKMVDGIITIMFDQSVFNFDSTGLAKAEHFKFLLLGLGMPRDRQRAISLLSDITPRNLARSLSLAIEDDNASRISDALKSRELGAGRGLSFLKPFVEHGEILPYTYPDLAKILEEHEVQFEDLDLSPDQLKVLLGDLRNVFVVKKDFDWTRLEKLIPRSTRFSLVVPPSIAPPNIRINGLVPIVIKMKQKTDAAGSE